MIFRRNAYPYSPLHGKTKEERYDEIGYPFRKKTESDCGKKIAEALSMSSMLLVTEMKLLGGGIMANAILSRFPMRRVNALKHKSQFFRYDAETTAKGKGGGAFPRIGCRSAAVADIETPLGTIRFYSDHFEMRCNAEGRLAQLQDLLTDAQRAACPSVIGGDLNTFLGGVTKLLPVNSGALSLVIHKYFEDVHMAWKPLEWRSEEFREIIRFEGPGRWPRLLDAVSFLFLRNNSVKGGFPFRLVAKRSKVSVVNMIPNVGFLTNKRRLAWALRDRSDAPHPRTAGFDACLVDFESKDWTERTLARIKADVWLSSSSSSSSFIFKPTNSTCGRGIRVFRNVASPRDLLDRVKERLDSDRRTYFVLQEYINAIALFPGRHKFDIRYYFLILSLNPLIVKTFDEGYIRCCSRTFPKEEKNDGKVDLAAHLTNSCMQSLLPGYDAATDSVNGYRLRRKWSELPLRNRVAKNIRACLKSTLEAVVPYMLMKKHLPATLTPKKDGKAWKRLTSPYSTGQFALMGADFLIRKDNVSPVLLEINQQPHMPYGTKEMHELHVCLMQSMQHEVSTHYGLVDAGVSAKAVGDSADRGFSMLIDETPGRCGGARVMTTAAIASDTYVKVEQFGMVQCPMTSTWLNHFWKFCVKDGHGIAEIVNFTEYFVGGKNGGPVNDDTWNTSFHGPQEIVGDKFHLCAKAQAGESAGWNLAENRTWLDYEACMNGDIGVAGAWELKRAKTCAERFELDYERLNSCANGVEGTALYKASVFYTSSQSIKYDTKHGIPVVRINGTVYQGLSAYEKIGSKICDAYDGDEKPANCGCGVTLDDNVNDDAWTEAQGGLY
eukprot:g3233.t1